jgi:hypothetical protein
MDEGVGLSQFLLFMTRCVSFSPLPAFSLSSSSLLQAGVSFSLHYLLFALCSGRCLSTTLTLGHSLNLSQILILIVS